MTVVVHPWQLPDRTLCLDARPLVMGIVNVTPDSFSDGGRFLSVENAITQGLRLVEQGADLLDIGGESSRPGAAPVPLDEEVRRVLPVVTELARATPVPLSVDTYKAEVARACLAAGAKIVNDITALTADPQMPDVVRESRAAVILMHMQGTPTTMQIKPAYDDVVHDIRNYFELRLQELQIAGIEPVRVALDPGIGFGKTTTHNLQLLGRLAEFQCLGRPICLGVSRKGFLGRILNREVHERLASSLAAVCFAQCQSAVQIVRVHDVAETRDAVLVIERIRASAEIT